MIKNVSLHFLKQNIVYHHGHFKEEKTIRGLFKKVGYVPTVDK